MTGKARVTTKSLIAGGVVWVLAAAPAAAQLATVGAGALFTERPTEPVFELHAETPPVVGLPLLDGARAYATLSWTDDRAAPTVITAAERPLLRYGPGFTGLGAGLLWLEPADYHPYPILVSSTALPLPVPRTSFVLIGSTQPFQDRAWSVVAKIGVTVLFIR